MSFIKVKKNSKKEDESNQQKNETYKFLGQKTTPTNSEMNLKIECKAINKNRGKWKEEEFNKFLEGIILHGTDWKKIQILVKSRTEGQIRSFYRKFYKKLILIKDEYVGIDLTSNDISNIIDIISEIKIANKNYSVFKVLKYFSNKYNIFISKKDDILDTNLFETNLHVEENKNNINDDSNDNNINSNNSFEMNKNNFNSINNINNNIIINQFSEINTLQYLLIMPNINLFVNNLSFDLLNKNLLLFYVCYLKYLNNYNKKEFNNNIIQIVIFLFLTKYIYDSYNYKNIINNSSSNR
jgi:hypothetical protein